MYQIYKNRKKLPVNILTHLSCGAYGLTSHIRRVLSIALDNRYDPSGLRDNPVTVSVWPFKWYKISFLRKSQTLISLSIPPLTTCSAVSLKVTAVT